MRTAANENNSPYDDVNELAARNLRMLLAAERWSGRKAALALGLNHMYVTRRLNGEAAISFTDVVAFAKLLKMEPAELTAKLCAPWDLNPEPAD